jgi:phospholipase C
MLRGFWIALIASVALVACTRGSWAPAPQSESAAAALAQIEGAAVPPGKIKHIVFVIQENRTFDNIFGGPNPYPGADGAKSGKTNDGKTIALAKIDLGTLLGTEDPNNYHRQWLWACNPTSGPPFTVGTPPPCQMDGFNIAASPHPNYTPPASTSSIYSYVDYAQTEPYWNIAREFTLGDRFFMGHNSESYTAHQFLFSAQSNRVAGAPDFNKPASYCGALYLGCAYTPWGCDSPPGTTTSVLDARGILRPGGPFPCFDYPALANRVDEAGLSWRLYAHSLCANINGLDANTSIRKTTVWPKSSQWMSGCHERTLREGFLPTKIDTKNFRTPETAFLSDMKGRQALASVTWILPGLVTSDHPGVPAGFCGPWWVANVVNAIGENRKYWDSTVIFILWDDWGGYYDHVRPYVVRDQQGPGFRVPLLVVSPYAKPGYVAHTDVEFATLLKFTEETLGLKNLGATDTTPYLNDLNDFFQSTAHPFTKIKVPSRISVPCSILPKNANLGSRSRWIQMDGDD